MYKVAYSQVLVVILLLGLYSALGQDGGQTTDGGRQKKVIKGKTVQEMAAKSNLPEWEVYKRLFMQQRKEQLDAVKSILQMGSYEKQYKMIEMLFEKIFDVVEKKRVLLIENGFLPTDEFPKDESIREAFSMVAEATAFFGDILLRLPDISHKIYERHKEWQVSLGWCITYLNQSDIFSIDSDQKLNLLSLVAQELQLVERDPNYINPYKTEVNEMIEEAKKQQQMEEKEKKKKKKKEKRKGPRLTGVRNEL
ncbi:unnamed protein product [Owenia fusiformis]|uniref:Uncharacterized protein n=1 Tax=Owenia fusiformis TaxID=6347 RepID=A0A8J1TEL9_OWEFU|nr:unnamed protein product [Owenia fusiformis]